MYTILTTHSIYMYAYTVVTSEYTQLQFIHVPTRTHSTEYPQYMDAHTVLSIRNIYMYTRSEYPYIHVYT